MPTRIVVCCLLAVAHGPILPGDVDQARDVVLLMAVQTSSLSILVLRAELSDRSRQGK